VGLLAKSADCANIISMAGPPRRDGPATVTLSEYEVFPNVASARVREVYHGAAPSVTAVNAWMAVCERAGSVPREIPDGVSRAVVGDARRNLVGVPRARVLGVRHRDFDMRCAAAAPGGGARLDRQCVVCNVGHVEFGAAPAAMLTGSEYVRRIMSM